jgi:hypothetical protein
VGVFVLARNPQRARRVGRGKAPSGDGALVVATQATRKSFCATQLRRGDLFRGAELVDRPVPLVTYERQESIDERRVAHDVVHQGLADCVDALLFGKSRQVHRAHERGDVIVLRQDARNALVGLVALRTNEELLSVRLLRRNWSAAGGTTFLYHDLLHGFGELLCGTIQQIRQESS